MNVRRIILTFAVFLEVHSWSAAQQPPGGGPPFGNYPGTTTPPAASGQPYIQPSTVIQPAPPVAPVYPPYPAGTTVVPLPSQTPGSIFGPPVVPAAPAVGIPTAPMGVEQLPLPPGAATAPIVVGPSVPGVPLPPGGVPMPPNPITVPVVDDDLAWDQIADVVSDYFTISRETRARRGEVYCEGRIETAPLDGATVLEPHRKDSVGWFNRWESTFQSIRRRATVRVVPDVNGYLVEVIVEKELEDLAKPEKATAGAAVFRTDGSLPSKRLEAVSRTRQSPCWISLGRDIELEQLMLADIHARLNGITGQRSVFAQ